MKLVSEIPSIKTQLDNNVQELNKIDYSHREKKIRPIVTITFDDGAIEDYRDVFPIFKKNNVCGSSAIITSLLDKTEYITTQNCIEMQQYGWEFASHGVNHTNEYPTLTNNELVTELKDSKEYLLSKGISCKNMFTPFGATDERVRSFQSEFYRSARVSGAGALGSTNKGAINTFRINSFLFGYKTQEQANTDSLDRLQDWKAQVDKCVNENSWLVFIAHSAPLINRGRGSDLDLLIQYCKSLGVDILTYDKALDVYQNKVDSKLIKIGADGTLSGQYGAIRRREIDDVIGTTAFENIDQSMLTYNAISNANYAQLPQQKGGTLITIKPDNTKERSFQLLKHYNDSENFYYRDIDGKFVNLVNIKVITDLPSTHSRLDLSGGKINVSIITKANSSGYPSSDGGLLTAYYLDNLSSNLYEEFKVANKTTTYKRVWNSTTNQWSEWVELIYNTNVLYDSVNIDTPVYNFPKGNSYCQINGNKASFPDGMNGMLETIYYGSHGYNYQYYHIYNTTKTYKRVWKADQTWSSFVLINS